MEIKQVDGKKFQELPFSPDKYTEALYHFNEGEGNAAYEACGDSELTLRSQTPIWRQHPDFGFVAGFTRRQDDANLFIGPVDNDKLHLRTSPKEWTVEAYVRYTGPIGNDLGYTYASICSTDEEGFSLPEGIRGGWTFALLTAESGDDLIPWARFIGSRERSGNNTMTSAKISPISDTRTELHAIADQQWHHVAWQFRQKDQQQFIFIDGKLICQWCKPRGVIINDVADTCIPFTVGGFIHSQDPPFYLGYGNFEGEICELRISSIMRYPVANQLAIIKQDLPYATCKAAYDVQLNCEGTDRNVQWHITEGSLPNGLTLDSDSGKIHGVAVEITDSMQVTISADDGSEFDQHNFLLAVKSPKITPATLPLAFIGIDYLHQFDTEFMIAPISWKLSPADLPSGMSFDASTGTLSGKPSSEAILDVQICAADAAGQIANCDCTFRIVPACLRNIELDEDTVVLYNWQGTNGKFIRDVAGDDELTLTWCNMFADQRLKRDKWGVYPRLVGGGEYGFVGPQANEKLDLKTCTKQWTVEAWVKPGGCINHYGQPFGFGHICGTYDNSKRGIWELYLAHDGYPDGSLAPGVHFFDATGDTAHMDLHPWRRSEGIVLEKIPGGRVADQRLIGIRDTEWHHVAWQYSYAEDLHELFLDGTLIWKMISPGGRQLINNRKHDAQFSVGSRLNGYAKYGGDFNWLGFGNFFGQIGEIRISKIRRY
jgi:hypothetical protein